ncbi:MAG: hypothetical protein MSB05_00555 [Firmicutes bacterium]|nr:hypothetical protein [Bacillota bacterium]
MFKARTAADRALKLGDGELDLGEVLYDGFRGANRRLRIYHTLPVLYIRNRTLHHAFEAVFLHRLVANER